MSKRISVALAIVGAIVIHASSLVGQRRTGATKDSTPVYLLPDASRTPLATLKRGEPVDVVEVQEGWVKVEFQDAVYGRRVGYAASANIAMAASPSGDPLPVEKSAASAPIPTPPPALSARRTPSASDRIAVFIKAAGAEGGFTDPSKDRSDSVKDLINRLRDSRTVQLAASQADAVVLLEVLSRETRRETNGWTFVTGDRQNKSYVTVRLTAGEYSTEFTGESRSSGMVKNYRDAAKKIVSQVEEWVNANRDRLLALAK